MTDIYQAPQSSLTESRSIEGYGSLEKGVAGDYDFSVSAVFSEALEKTKGAKWDFHKGYAVYFVVYLLLIGVQMVLLYLGGGFDENTGDSVPALVSNIAGQILVTVFSLPLGAGIFIMGLRRAVDAPVHAGLVVAYYHKTLQLFLTALLMYLMLIVGFLCLILPGIYLMFAYMYAMPLVVDKNLGPWQALEASRKAITKRWFTFVGLWIVMIIALVISAVPLGIGMIWTLPLMTIAFGIVYRNMFGCESETLQD